MLDLCNVADRASPQARELLILKIKVAPAVANVQESVGYNDNGVAEGCEWLNKNVKAFSAPI